MITTYDFVPGLINPSESSTEGYWFIFQNRNLLVSLDYQLEVSSGPFRMGLEPLRTQYLGELKGEKCFSGEVSKDSEIVLVHDGVRPFLSQKMVADSIDAAREYGAAITAIPVHDTIKRVDTSGLVSQTIDREGLWRVQTPQAFRYSLLLDAFNKAKSENFYGTDEGALIEHLGEPVKIVEGLEQNIKITRPEDLELSKAFISRLFPET